MRAREPRSLGWAVGLLIFFSLCFLAAEEALAWKLLPKEGIFVYPRIDGVGYLTDKVPQGIGRVRTTLAEKAVHIGEGETVYLDVGSRQGILVGDRLKAFSLDKPKDLKDLRVVVMEARLVVTAVKEDEAEAKVEDSYRSLSLGARVERYEPMESKIKLKPAVPSLTGRIIWSYENLVSFGEGDVVFLDKGRLHGVEPGQCYQVFRTPMEEVERLLPSERDKKRDHIAAAVGELIVLRTEEATSAALVRKSSLPLERGDRFRAGCGLEKELRAVQVAAAPKPAAEGEDELKKAMKEFQERDVLFPYDSYVLSPEARAILQDKAKFLQQNPTMETLIEGHCDERGTKEYNLALGDRRAQAAKRYLMGLGISPERMKTVSYGKERPVDPGHNEEAWAKNRRAHFVLQEK
ncbi:MAG: peptidoglycan-associated lipoprotein Pal [bacterium]